MIKGKPFVKWAGGKRQIIGELKKHIPEEYNTYYEPFIGGGALLFELSPKRAVINDSNKELMNVYQVLCDEELFKKMCRVLNDYEKNHSEEFFYEIRNKDRSKASFNKLSSYTRAARTIYLNKACFNGLYRVNSKGEFNVPFGKKIKVNTYEGNNLITVSNYLTMNDIKILNTDFEEAVSCAKKHDFVYFDPPYDTDTSIFNSYTETGFDKDEQRRLAKVFYELDKKGVYVMLSNHNTNLIKELYIDYNIYKVKARRNINSNASKRGLVEEIIITNFKNEESF